MESILPGQTQPFLKIIFKKVNSIFTVIFKLSNLLATLRLPPAPQPSRGAGRDHWGSPSASWPASSEDSTPFPGSWPAAQISARTRRTLSKPVKRLFAMPISVYTRCQESAHSPWHVSMLWNTPRSWLWATSPGGQTASSCQYATLSIHFYLTTTNNIDQLHCKLLAVLILTWF